MRWWSANRENGRPTHDDRPGAEGLDGRVAYKGHRRAQVCRTKEEARQAEAELLRELKAEAAREEQEGARPATLKTLFEYHVADLDARGKGPDTIGRAVATAKAVEALVPDWLNAPVGRIRDRDVFTFRQARLRAGAKPSTINRDLRTLRPYSRRRDRTSDFQARRSSPKMRRGCVGGDRRKKASLMSISMGG